MYADRGVAKPLTWRTWAKPRQADSERAHVSSKVVAGGEWPERHLRNRRTSSCALRAPTPPARDDRRLAGATPLVAVGRVLLSSVRRLVAGPRTRCRRSTPRNPASRLCAHRRSACQVGITSGVSLRFGVLVNRSSCPTCVSIGTTCAKIVLCDIACRIVGGSQQPVLGSEPQATSSRRPRHATVPSLDPPPHCHWALALLWPPLPHGQPALPVCR